MKIALISTHVRWTPHLETELEIIQKHLDAKDDVVHIVCNGALEVCDTNMNGHRGRCYNCVSRRLIGKKLLSTKVRTVPLALNTTDSVSHHRVNQEQIKTYCYKDFDVGAAALSSVISSTRRSEITSMEMKTINFLISRGEQLYDWMLSFLEREKPDAVYVFNGRFIYNRAVLRACQSTNVWVNVHERGSTIHRYEIFKNTLPHDIEYTHGRILDAWETANPPLHEKEALAKSFFEERMAGVQQSWYSYVSGQEQERLPPNWDKSKRNIVIYNSSENEFASIGEQWKRYVYPSQVSGIEDICRHFQNEDSIRFYLRAHPALLRGPGPDMERLFALQLVNLTVIYPKGPESSYTLMREADQVITFGSTVGIEAAYLGTPSILLGSSFFRELGSTYNPLTKDELYGLIARRLPSKPILGSMKYGYYSRTYGIPFKNFKADGITKGTYKGVRIPKLKTIPIVLRVAGKFLPRKVNDWLLSTMVWLKRALYYRKAEGFW